MSHIPGSDHFPPGFSYVPDFLTEGEEQELLQIIGNLELHPFKFQGFEAKRKVASFGFDYHFDNRKLVKGKAIPQGFQRLLDKVGATLGIQPSLFAELLVTEYPPGSVINWHRDAPPFGVVAGVSLLSGCRFRLKPYDKELQNRKSLLSLPLGRRSLYVMQGDAREKWQHSISPVNQRRYSVTLRTLKKEWASEG